MPIDISNLSKKIDLSAGEWVSDIPEHPGLRLRVRSQHYKPYKAASGAFFRKNRKEVETDEGFEAVIAGNGKHLAEHLLVDWDMSKATGPFALSSDGQPVQYSPEVALMVLSGEDDHGICAEYRGAVLWAAAKVAEDFTKELSEASGN